MRVSREGGGWGRQLLQGAAFHTGGGGGGGGGPPPQGYAGSGADISNGDMTSHHGATFPVRDCAVRTSVILR